jgi:hypothetical protein
VLESEDAAKAAKERAESISKSAKDGMPARLDLEPPVFPLATGPNATTESFHSFFFTELVVFKERRQKAFRKGIVQYTQSQIRQGRVGDWAAVYIETQGCGA